MYTMGAGNQSVANMSNKMNKPIVFVSSIVLDNSSRTTAMTGPRERVVATRKVYRGSWAAVVRLAKPKQAGRRRQ